MTDGRVISWFSCGAASAVASKLAISIYKNYQEPVEIVYQETNSEHLDNERFLSDCEDWFGQGIKRISSDKYHDIWEVFEKTRYLAGVNGARCTYELKRKIAENYIEHGRDIEVFGYTAEEQGRVDRFKENNPERMIDAILVDRGLTKEDCLGMLDKAGIEIPKMYRLGYTNNNCIGCVKGQMGYWNKIREDFPEVFDRMAKMERELGAAICKSYAGDGERKRVFLDELDPEAGNHLEEPRISCGIMCEIESQNLVEETRERVSL